MPDYSNESLVKRAVINARPHINSPAPRWVAVMHTFALGQTYAIELCKLYGLDPDEIIGCRSEAEWRPSGSVITYETRT